MDVITDYYIPKMRYKYTLSGIEEDVISIYEIIKRRLPPEQRRKLEERQDKVIDEILKEKARQESASLTEFVLRNPWVLYAGGALLIYFLFVRKR